MNTDLNDSANFAGRMARNGIVKKDTAKHTAAPIMHPINPSNLFTETFRSRNPGYRS